jgi:hypothetical protein
MMISNSTEACINWQLSIKSKFINKFKNTFLIARGKDI